MPYFSKKLLSNLLSKSSLSNWPYSTPSLNQTPSATPTRFPAYSASSNLPSVPSLTPASTSNTLNQTLNPLGNKNVDFTNTPTFTDTVVSNTNNGLGYYNWNENKPDLNGAINNELGENNENIPNVNNEAYGITKTENVWRPY